MSWDGGRNGNARAGYQTSKSDRCELYSGDQGLHTLQMGYLIHMRGFFDTADFIVYTAYSVEMRYYSTDQKVTCSREAV